MIWFQLAGTRDAIPSALLFVDPVQQAAVVALERIFEPDVLVGSIRTHEGFRRCCPEVPVAITGFHLGLAGTVAYLESGGGEAGSTSSLYAALKMPGTP